MGELIDNGSVAITTQNLNPLTGVPTAGSFARIDLSDNSASTITFQVLGTYTGVLTPQVSQDDSTWVTLGGTQILSLGTGLYMVTIASALNGVFQIDVSSVRYFRLSALAAVTGTANVRITASDGTGQVGINKALPAGAAAIGSVTLGSPLTAATTSITKAEDAIHATGDSGVMDLGVRYETLTAAAAAGDYGFKQVDDLGKTINMPYSPTVNQKQGITAAMAATADVQLFAAAGAGVRTYITDLVFTNTHATVGTEIQVKDNTTAVLRVYLPALSDERISLNTPLKFTANTIVNVANTTTGSNTFVSATGFNAL